MVKKAANQDRRTTGVQKSGRATRVVNSIMKATGEQLNEVGYAALKVEDVAERAGVNKTTIYRRWPTKDQLVIETLRSTYNQQQVIPDAGNLRDDLLAYINHLVTRMKDPIPRGVAVTLHNCTDPAIKPIADELLKRARQGRVELIKRGIERGELPEDTDPELISDLFSAPILRRLLTFGEKLKPGYVEAIIDTVIAGANAVGNTKGSVKLAAQT